MPGDTQEQLFVLPDGRELAYSLAGDDSSATILLYLHGAFTVGDASRVNKVILHKNIRYIAPTLPGWGNSSPLPKTANYARAFAEDMAALLTHLHPDNSTLKVYVAGGSFGTVPAQILYGAPFDIFPQGTCIRGLLLLGALSPFRHHKEYTRSLTMSNYIMIGPPSQIIPFNLVARLVALSIRRINTVESAGAFLRDKLFAGMDAEERDAYARWRRDSGRTDEDLIQEMAENMLRSVSRTWDGFFEMPKILHSDWGFSPSTLDEEHAKRQILVVTGSKDDMSPVSMGEWLVANYKNARLKCPPGGHLAPLFHMDEIFEEFLENE